MSEVTLLLIRFLYLAVLWIFVLSCISVIRSDMFGSRAPRTKAPKEKKQRTKAPKARRGDPREVAITEGADRGQSISLADAPLLIGRGSDAAIKLTDDYASTRHARIARSGDQWFIEDLGSTNGTYVNNHRITQPTSISLGSQVRIGKTILELRK
ncbi:MAG TPA: FHA domain-containing protein [Marmoricola sp.]|nr:FHA domain-containing protein [Marmoricola sp.]HNI70652.1 FHA domain-containing protein [Marmoricola sp.]HNN48412.1 FHA domain-containing protein [Marmoricola sp.]